MEKFKDVLAYTVLIVFVLSILIGMVWQAAIHTHFRRVLLIIAATLVVIGSIVWAIDRIGNG